MTSGNGSTSRLLTILVFIVSLSHQTTGGSWRNLEKLFIQEDPASKHWNDNRIIFPDSEEDRVLPSSRPPSTLRFEEPRPCQDRCLTSKDFSPVCGTNGLTYENMAQLQCDIACGVDVDLHRPNACSTFVPPTTKRYTTVTTTTTTTTSALDPNTVKNEEVEQCINTCPTTPEYNPVCGSNKVTYFNLGKLECARYCGVEIETWRYSRCPTITTTSTTVAPTTNNDLDEEVQQCIINCPSTVEYNPVCGSNNITYNNIARLQCAKWCGVDVTLKKMGRCTYLSYALPPNSNNFDSTAPDVDYGEDLIDTRFRPLNQRQFHRK